MVTTFLNELGWFDQTEAISQLCHVAIIAINEFNLTKRNQKLQKNERRKCTHKHFGMISYVKKVRINEDIMSKSWYITYIYIYTKTYLKIFNKQKNIKIKNYISVQLIFFFDANNVNLFTLASIHSNVKCVFFIGTYLSLAYIDQSASSWWLMIFADKRIHIIASY